MAITLMNQTNYVAQFVVCQGELIINKYIELAPEAMLEVPTGWTAEIHAVTMIEGNTYTSATTTVTGPAGFLAQTKQIQQQDSYEFEVVEVAYTAPNELQFQQTCRSPVVFNISINGKPQQAVVVDNSFTIKSVNIGTTYSIYAVINGITTEVAQTSNHAATVTAIVDTSVFEQGFYSLLVS